MPENMTPPSPTEPPPQPVQSEAPTGSVVVPPLEPIRKGPGLLWLAILLAVLAVGGGGYYLYAQLQRPVESVSVTPPRLVNQDAKPDQGFGTQPVTTTALNATPTITSSDNVSDIEKDLTGTTIEGENASEFDADFQSL